MMSSTIIEFDDKTDLSLVLFSAMLKGEIDKLKQGQGLTVIYSPTFYAYVKFADSGVFEVELTQRDEVVNFSFNDADLVVNHLSANYCFERIINDTEWL